MDVPQRPVARLSDGAPLSEIVCPTCGSHFQSQASAVCETVECPNCRTAAQISRATSPEDRGSAATVRKSHPLGNDPLGFLNDVNAPTPRSMRTLARIERRNRDPRPAAFSVITGVSFAAFIVIVTIIIVLKTGAFAWMFRSPSDPRNLIIGRWRTVEGEAYHRFNDDGTVVVDVGELRMIGTYEFLDDHHIRFTYFNDQNSPTSTFVNAVDVTEDALTFWGQTEGPKRNRRSP